MSKNTNIQLRVSAKEIVILRQLQRRYRTESLSHALRLTIQDAGKLLLPLTHEERQQLKEDIEE